jgi:DNA invertase Pin-like site-specific DNA recombinase
MKHTNQPLPVPETQPHRAQLKFITYYRVSTDRQGRWGLGLEAQREALAQFLSDRHGEVITEFVEVESGARNDRPQLALALDACRRHRAGLLIAKLDRLARNVAFIANLMESNIDFTAIDMPDASKLLLHVMAAFAEHEREMISQRTKAALSAAKARGVQLGANGRALADKHRLEATAYAQTLTPHIASAVRAGASCFAGIAAHLNALGIPARNGGVWYPASAARVWKRIHGSLCIGTARKLFTPDFPDSERPGAQRPLKIESEGRTVPILVC